MLWLFTVATIDHKVVAVHGWKRMETRAEIWSTWANGPEHLIASSVDFFHFTAKDLLLIQGTMATNPMAAIGSIVLRKLNLNTTIRTMSRVPRIFKAESKAAEEQREGIRQLLLSMTDLELDLHSTANSVPQTPDTVAYGKNIKSRIPARKYWMSKGTYEHSLNHSRMICSEVCPGCHQVFEKAKSINGSYSYAFLVHLIEECQRYKQLNLIAECNECNYKFINRTRYIMHESKCHSNRPSWMLKSIYARTHRQVAYKSVPCLGCGKELKKSVKSNFYRLQDYTHMMEECDGYQALNLIRQCDRCGCKFLNSKGLLRHQLYSTCRDEK